MRRAHFGDGGVGCFAVLEEFMEKDVVIIKEGRGIRAVLPSDIDHHSAKNIRESIDRALSSVPCRLVLDFSEVSFMDSSGIGLIIGRSEQARRYGIPVELVGVRGDIMRLMRICGIEKIRDLYIVQ